MNASRGEIVHFSMSNNPPLTPREKEIHALFDRGKTPDVIAIRLGMKISKVMQVIGMLPKALV